MIPIHPYDTLNITLGAVQVSRDRLGSGGRMSMEEGGWMRRAEEEEGAQPRMKVTDRMVIDCK